MITSTPSISIETRVGGENRFLREVSKDLTISTEDTEPGTEVMVVQTRVHASDRVEVYVVVTSSQSSIGKGNIAVYVVGKQSQ
jgi:hypothetical protein